MFIFAKKHSDKLIKHFKHKKKWCESIIFFPMARLNVEGLPDMLRRPRHSAASSHRPRWWWKMSLWNTLREPLLRWDFTILCPRRGWCPANMIDMVVCLQPKIIIHLLVFFRNISSVNHVLNSLFQATERNNQWGPLCNWSCRHFPRLIPSYSIHFSKWVVTSNMSAVVATSKPWWDDQQPISNLAYSTHEP